MSVAPQTDPAAERACHDLLVRLAGRLPERLLWRLRDWLASGAHPALVRSLPKALLRHRIGLTDAERDLMEVCLPSWGAPSRLLDAVLPATDPVQVSAKFQTELEPGEPCADVANPAGWRDSVDLMLAAVVRSHPGARELRRSWRMDHTRPQRVVLAHVTENLPALTGVMQRILRAHGDLTPAVEVVSPPLALPPYHRLALRESVSLWRSPDRDPAARSRRGSTGSLVDA
jgi:hypothetical protein